MKISIVIRTLNEARYLPQLLVGIEKQSIDNNEIEVIVVDSGSTDGTPRIAERFGARLLHIDRNEFSFGRSLNRGCNAALGEFLVLISGHCVPENDNWLEELIAPFEDEKVAITYGRQLAGPETQFSEKQLFANYFPDSDTTPPNEFFCNNANAAVRKSIWEEYKYDEEVTGLEDMLLGKEVVKDGHRVQYCHRAGVYHYHHEAWSQIKRRFEREAIALQQIMPEVHVSMLDGVRYWFAGVLGDWSVAISEKQFLKQALSIATYRACQYYGAWRGNHAHRALSRAAKERYFYPRASRSSESENLAISTESSQQASSAT